MLEQAKLLLKSEYEKCLQVVKKDNFYVNYTTEKWVHSRQVLGAGNFIIKHEPWFQKQPDDVIDAAKTALLLHDVARFEEITRRFLEGIKIDHGERAYEKLKEMSEYDEWLVAFAIKHHGHVKECFYEDESYLALKDENLRDQVEHIFWLVRDADKIANFNIVCEEREKYLELFLPSPDKVDYSEKKPTEPILHDFYDNKTVDYSLRKSVPDYILAFLSWYFDLNYKSSVVFCEKLNLPDKMFAIFEQYCDDQVLNDKLKSYLKDYLKRFV